jgi:hypothetical protein
MCVPLRVNTIQSTGAQALRPYGSTVPIKYNAG